MSRYFFSGGIMPGDDLFSNYSDDLTIEKKWTWNGQHYQKTCETWLANMDQNRDEIMSVLSQTYGEADAVRWYNRWRMFYLACSELFGYSFGNEWWLAGRTGHAQALVFRDCNCCASYQQRTISA
jgi:cyclopropane-fatty-acyl-phospholipid synthase